MICIITCNQELARELSALLNHVTQAIRVVDANSQECLQELYASGITGAIVDETLPHIPNHAWHDLLGSLGRRIPVFVLGQANQSDHTFAVASRNAELLTHVENPNARELVTMLEAAHAIDLSTRSASTSSIPLYNAQVALHMLKGNGAMRMLTINANSFRNVSIDYGVEAYQKLQDCFQDILNTMWGSPGCFRRTDMLMRRSAHSNTYYVFLEQSRQSHTVPAPGVLEKMADRITVRIQKEFWDEIFKPIASRKIPDCISVIPEVSIGHSTALYNPSVDAVEVVEHMHESAVEVAKVQVRRIKDRGRELMQTLIQTRDLLYPHYQAVFELQGLTKKMLDQSKKDNSIAPMSSQLFGFESLIRVHEKVVEEVLAGDHLVHMETRLLRPDIMFAMAHQAKVALELDQVCLALGIQHAVDLPGKLMVNILPRNLLHIERLMHLLTPRGNVCFELSESEGVNNNKLMARIRDYVSKIGCSLAADDFGKGYASIERVIKLRPEIIKLDRSLVENIHKDPAKRSFVDGIVKAGKLAHSLVLAEGVELWEEAAVVQSMGVDLIQGFLCHRPQSLEVLMPQLEGTADDQLDSVA